MLSLVRNLRPGLFLSGRDRKQNGALFQLSHNLKIWPIINATKINNDRARMESSSSESIKKYINYLVEEYKKSMTINDDLISEQGYVEISRLVKNRLTVEDSMRSLEDLVRQDPEMKKLGEEEYSSYKDELENLNEKLLSAIIHNVGRENIRDIILEITTGVGGQEAMIFAKDLYTMYLGYLHYLDFSYEIISEDAATAVDGIRHASIAITGERALEIFRHEGGVHRVQRIPATEKSGRIHTSTVSVAILPQPSEIEVVLKDQDLRIETKNASGAGGQHVNTTDSAVRITHFPTGIIVESQSSRSQIKNREKAILELRMKIYKKQLNEQREISGEMRKKQIGLGQRNEKIRTYNFNQDRVTDHRIANGTMHNLKGFLEGGQYLHELQTKLQNNLQMKILDEAIQKMAK